MHGDYGMCVCKCVSEFVVRRLPSSFSIRKRKKEEEGNEISVGRHSIPVLITRDSLSRWVTGCPSGRSHGERSNECEREMK